MEERLEFADLTKDLLNLNPESLVAWRPNPKLHDEAVLFALQAFMRQVLELANQLGVQPGPLTLRLVPDDETARRHGWSDMRAANLGLLLVWAMIRERRWYEGLPFAELDKTTEGNAPIRVAARFRRMSIMALVENFERPMVQKPSSTRTTDDERFPISVYKLVREMLKVEPATLTRNTRSSEEELETVYAGFPESRTLGGLMTLMEDVLCQYREMEKRETDKIRLMTEQDADWAERPSARAANISVLLAAALHADERKYVIYFVPPRVRTKDEEAMLRAAAKLVYLDHSDEAMKGLELICEGCVHFGHRRGFSLGEKLLHSISKECDAQPERKPTTVQLQDLCEEMRKGAVERRREGSKAFVLN